MEDELWVALNNAIKVLKPPKSNQKGRNFTFDENNIKDVIPMKNYFFPEFSYEHLFYLISEQCSK